MMKESTPLQIIEINSKPEPDLLHQLYDLNQENVPEVGSLSSLKELNDLIQMSNITRYILSENKIIAFLVCFREGSKYHSLNYKFFNQHEKEFLYVDRVAVKKGFINQGLGSRLYGQLYEECQDALLPICCEVNTYPVNQISLNFHSKNGFQDVGKFEFDDHSVVYLKKINHYA